MPMATKLTRCLQRFRCNKLAATDERIEAASKIDTAMSTCNFFLTPAITPEADPQQHLARRNKKTARLPLPDMQVSSDKDRAYVAHAEESGRF